MLAPPGHEKRPDMVIFACEDRLPEPSKRQLLLYSSTPFSMFSDQFLGLLAGSNGASDVKDISYWETPSSGF
jgi:hypothetical protein